MPSGKLRGDGARRCLRRPLWHNVRENVTKEPSLGSRPPLLGKRLPDSDFVCSDKACTIGTSAASVSTIASNLAVFFVA